MPKVRFTDNYRDHSTEAGYQFEFFCERCGNGYKSGFQASALGVGSKIARGLGGLLGGGGLSNVGYAGSEAKDLTESQAKDKALAKAVEEMEPYFRQCHRCGQWVCLEICWNEEAGLCVQDAPKVEQELAQAQAQAQVGQIREKAQQVDWTEGINVERRQVALCPNCGTETEPSAKFCGNCGQVLTAPVTCARCGTESPPGTKFCPECGNQL